MGMKKMAALVMALALCLMAVSAMAATIDVPGAGSVTLAGAIAAANPGDIINLTDDINLGTTSIDIAKSLTIKGNGKTITGTAQKTFTVNASTASSLIDITFDNVKIVNNYTSVGSNTSRCIDTRNGAFRLTINNSTLTATSAGNNQALNLGGYDNSNEQTVVVRNSTIDAGDAGYGITTWVKSSITVDNSTMNGYAALYFKDGSADTTANITNSTINGVAHAGEEFGAVVFETKPIHVNSSGNTYNVSNTGDSDYAAFLDKTGAPDNNSVMSSGDKYNGVASNGSVYVQYPAVAADLPQTGDSSNLLLFTTLLAMSAAGLTVVRRKREN